MKKRSKKAQRVNNFELLGFIQNFIFDSVKVKAWLLMVNKKLCISGQSIIYNANRLFDENSNNYQLKGKNKEFKILWEIDLKLGKQIWCLYRT